MTKEERQILANQYRILSFLDKKDEEEDYLRKVHILEAGFTGAYDEVVVSDDEIPEEVCNEVRRILRMGLKVQNAIATVQENDNKNDYSKIEFNGFDSHDTQHHGYAQFLFSKKGQYEWFADTPLDNHGKFPLYLYQQMLDVDQQYTMSYDEQEYLDALMGAVG